MAIYQFNFGTVNVADGIPPFSLELRIWVEQQVALKIQEVLQMAVDRAMREPIKLLTEEDLDAAIGRQLNKMRQELGPLPKPDPVYDMPTLVMDDV